MHIDGNMLFVLCATLVLATAGVILLVTRPKQTKAEIVNDVPPPPFDVPQVKPAERKRTRKVVKVLRIRHGEVTNQVLYLAELLCADRRDRFYVIRKDNGVIAKRSQHRCEIVTRS